MASYCLTPAPVFVPVVHLLSGACYLRAIVLVPAGNAKVHCTGTWKQKSAPPRRRLSQCRAPLGLNSAVAVDECRQ